MVSRGRGAAPEEEVRAGVRVRRVPEPSVPRDLDEFLAWVDRMNADMLAAARSLSRHGRVDLVHGHDWLVSPAASELASELGVPYVTTVHATEHGRHQGHVERHPQSHIHAVESAMVRRAELVIVCSRFMRRHLADVFAIPAAKVRVIPNGIDAADLVPVSDLDALRARFAKPDEQLVVLAGRLVYEKGFQFALEALRSVIRRLPGVRFVVAGSGTHEEELKRQARRLGLTRHGTFVGWVDDEMLHSLYRVADLCVVPSIYEPFGLVVLEAMASGCPCIVADTGGLREVVPNEEVGLRFRSSDPARLADAVERVLTDEGLRQRLVTEAAEHVHRFDWSRIAATTAAEYAALCERADTAAASG